MKKKKVLFISSSGGHFNELMQLENMFKKYDYHIITEKTKTYKSLIKKYNKKINFLVCGTRKHKVSYFFKLIYNTFKSIILYIKFRPKYIISTGAHTAGPMCLIGKIFGSKIIFIESFANINSKTLTGRIVYKFADLFIVQWKSMLKLYPESIYGGGIFK